MESPHTFVKHDDALPRAPIQEKTEAIKQSVQPVFFPLSHYSPYSLMLFPHTAPAN